MPMYPPQVLGSAHQQMLEVISQIADFADIRDTLVPETKLYEMSGREILVRADPWFMEPVIKFCDLHSEFLNSKPSHIEVDERLFGGEMVALLFIAVGRAFGLFDWVEKDGLVVITKYSPKP